MRLLYKSNGQPYLSEWMVRMRRSHYRAYAMKQVRHRRYIEALVEETHLTAPDIVPLYADVLADLESKAQITTYLPILAWKKVKSILRDRMRQI